jgi:hypothetical protein
MDEATLEQAKPQFLEAVRASRQREFVRTLLEVAAPAFSERPRVTGEG